MHLLQNTARAFALLFATLLLPNAASAAVRAVTTDLDDGPGSLRQVIADAQDGDTVVIGLMSPAGVITLTTGSIAISSDIRIVGPGADRLTITRDGTADRAFVVATGTTVVISGMTFSGLSTTDDGGAIDSRGNLTLRDCVFVNNSAARGGAVAADDVLDVARCRFEGNMASEGGGVFGQRLGTADDAKSMSIEDSTFIGNSATVYGAGVRVYARYGYTYIRNSTFDSNTSDSGKGCDVNASNDNDNSTGTVFLTHNSFGSDGCDSNVFVWGTGPRMVNAYFAGNLFSSDAATPVRRQQLGVPYSLGGNVGAGPNAFPTPNAADIAASTGVGAGVDGGGAYYLPLDPTSNALFASSCAGADGQPVQFDQLGQARTARKDGVRVCTAGAFEPATTPLVDALPRAADATCAAGGFDILTGFDVNGDGDLTGNEILSSDPLCSGADGMNGADGMDGADGTDGLDGSAALFDSSDVLAGDATCPEGGVRIRGGIDADGNGSLAASEVSSEVVVCALRGPAGSGGCTVAGDASAVPPVWLLGIALALLVRRQGSNRHH